MTENEISKLRLKTFSVQPELGKKCILPGLLLFSLILFRFCDLFVCIGTKQKLQHPYEREREREREREKERDRQRAREKETEREREGGREWGVVEVWRKTF